MTSTFEGLAFVCPRCRGPLTTQSDAFACAACETSYPVVTGIPDFRIAPDPWIGFAADREKGLRLERETAGQDFETMVRAYWAMTPETPRPMAEQFIAHVCGAEARSREWLHAVGAESRQKGSWIDLGCGTADIAAAAGPDARVVGIDVAFRWLVVARRRLEERGISPLLVCGNAEALPFSDRGFERALSLGTLEHCRDADAALREARRVLVPGGSLHLRTGNKHSILHRRMNFVHHWPRSAREIRLAMRRVGFLRYRVEAAPTLDAERERLSPLMQRAVPAYTQLRRAPVSGTVLRWLSPMLEASAVAP